MSLRKTLLKIVGIPIVATLSLTGLYSSYRYLDARLDGREDSQVIVSPNIVEQDPIIMAGLFAGSYCAYKKYRRKKDERH